MHLRDAALAVSGDEFAALKDRIGFELNGLPIYAEVDAGYPAEAEVDAASLAYLPEPAADGSDFKAIRITDETLVVSWKAQARIHYDASLSVSMRDPIDRDYVNLPGMSVEGEQEVELEILITFDRRADVAHPGFTFDTADIVEKDLWLDLGYVEYSLAGED